MVVLVEDTEVIDLVERHEAVSTSEMHQQVLSQAVQEPGSVLVKNLVVKDKKKRVYLVVIEHDRVLDLKWLAKNLPEKGVGALRFVEQDQLMEVLGVCKGSVTPLAVRHAVSTSAIASHPGMPAPLTFTKPWSPCG